MQRVNFIFEGMEYSAAFDDDGDCTGVYSYGEHRFLNENTETNERERPHVWTAAYTMMDG